MTKPAIVDSHCHLDFPDFDGQLPEIITNAAVAGVTRMVSICTKLRNEPQVRAIAENHPSVFYAVGTHPMSVANEPMASINDLVDIAQHPKMIGIGETGLDYHYTADSKSIQQESLRIHIEASRQTSLPLIIHSRAADTDMARILTEEHAKSTFSCVMHCFSSSAELAQAMLDLDFYLSMSGIATFKKSEALRAIFASAPVDRILVETDAPYLAPQAYRGKRNEPAYTALTAATGAEVFKMEYADFAAQTSENFDRLFPKAAAWKPA